MKKLTKKLWSHTTVDNARRQSVEDIRKSDPRVVKTYRDMVRKIAMISFNNPDLNLFFRGQCQEHKIKKLGTSLYPPIFREDKEGRLDSDVLKERYTKLHRASKMLILRYKKAKWLGYTKLETFSEISWAILQHYEVCDTPLLDITSSLRVACSFALRRSKNNAIIYVIGLPYTNGSISYYADEEQIILRLISICLPSALRPYYQEGYLIGTFPTTEVKTKVPSLDVANRLVAKFKIPKASFWDEQFHEIPDDALFPLNDPMIAITEEIKEIVRGIT